jgi:RNA polymerase sigma factor (sigma-70 family)
MKVGVTDFRHLPEHVGNTITKTRLMINFSSGPVLISEQELISQLQQGDQQALEYLYRSYWPLIAHFVWLNQGRAEEAEDLFQDGIIILYEKLRSKDFRLQYSLKTYLYGICRNQWLKRLRAKKSFMIRDISDYLENLPELIEEEPDLPDREDMYQAIQKLENPCFTLIIGFYYEKKTFEELAQALQYSNANVAKQRKFRCLERLKKMFLP